MQNVAWPTMIARTPRGSPTVANVVLRAMPVTMPGSAIGKIRTKDTTSRPKKACRATASAASDPSTRAIAVAPRATAIDVRNASRRPVLATASSSHFSDSEVGGQADVPVSLNA